ncbi:hypothetical protein [Sphingomonas sp. CROZ-RG-20F-R02-07]|uniref:hypothetical protein n=1 Tax=Sphingomonas sp. CROZ-RG-20F-R02-07 TaxID=2914832 RepID=UPI001F57D305|nr:hypothetical protein [Sphingomonas sp. CROZ-RG-20F-R02-07]
MIAFPRLHSLGPHAPTIGGAVGGAIVVLACVFMPTALLERAVWASGVAALVPAAAPPLGVTARGVLALVAGGLTAAILWSALYLLFGPGGVLDQTRMGERDVRAQRSESKQRAVPAVRRADAHPDAPPRRPVSAAELGTPLMDVAPVERSLPRDLEQPLAAFDPAAIPPEPRAPVRPVAPLTGRPAAPKPAAKPIARIETFALNPAPASASKPAPAPPQTIESLLRRLEQGASRRARTH